MAGAAVLPVQAQPAGWHPATATRPALVAGIDANTDHPAVRVARGESRSGVDANTFLVRPPAAVSWVDGPAASGLPRYAQVAMPAAVR